MDPLILPTIQNISAMRYFYSQSDSHCLGALGYTARHQGDNRSPEELMQLIPSLREALHLVRNDS